MATLAHALQVVGWWIAPLIIFLVQRKSRFVSFHALQALLLQIAYLIVMMGFMVLWFAAFFGIMVHQHGSDNAPPPAFFIMVPFIWLGFMGMFATVLVIAIVYAIKAGRGEWANYPVLGKIARRILKMNETDPIPVSSNANPVG
ncbi:MAG: DUF4870 domain-containing protein [Acidobacteriia bacterium]|nr:DUF4870 domain-containing protein [Terriglobia bacterium]